MPRTLVVTNDFPTRQGGIEAFVAALCERMPADEVVVYTASMPGDEKYDAGLPYPVVRDPTRMLVPTPRVRRRVISAFTTYCCDRVLFGASAPLGLLAPSLRAAGAERLVALTHGHEVWWARVPAARQALRRIGDSVDVMTYISGYCREAIAGALSAPAARRMQRLAPGVDTERFRPDCGGAEVRDRLGLVADQPVVACIARLVARKGQDSLIRAWPAVRAVVPDAQLLIVGDGPHRSKLDRLVRDLGLLDCVIFTGPVPWVGIPPYFDAADVFAMPCRTRLGGLEPEGLGIVFLEGAACGLPVLVGDSGGAPDAVRHGETGFLVNPREIRSVSARLIELLTDMEAARAMGDQGRRWVEAEWHWDAVGERCRELLSG